MISSELMLGEAAILELSGERRSNPGSLAALLTAHSGEVLLDPGPETKLKQVKGLEPRTLYLQREADYLLNALDNRWVLISNENNAENLYRSLASRLSKSDPVLDGEDLFTRIMKREEALATTLGHGVALPHAKIRGLAKSTCAVAVLPNGLAYEGEEDLIRLVFMLVSPEDQPEMHLALLGEIARLCADEEVRNLMFASESEDDFLPIVRQYRRQHTPFAEARG